MNDFGRFFSAVAKMLLNSLTEIENQEVEFYLW